MPGNHSCECDFKITLLIFQNENVKSQKEMRTHARKMDNTTPFGKMTMIFDFAAKRLIGKLDLDHVQDSPSQKINMRKPKEPLLIGNEIGKNFGHFSCPLHFARNIITDQNIHSAEIYKGKITEEYFITNKTCQLWEIMDNQLR